MDLTLLNKTREFKLHIDSDIKYEFPKISNLVSKLYLSMSSNLTDYFKNLQYGNFMFVQLCGSWNISKQSPIYLPSCVEIVRIYSFKSTEIYLQFPKRGFTKLKYLELKGNCRYSYESISLKIDGCYHDELEMISSDYPPNLDCNS